MEVKPVVNGEVRTGVAALMAVAGGPQGAAGGKRTRLGMGPWGFFFLPCAPPAHGLMLL
jgi:hypothetical protein